MAEATARHILVSSEEQCQKLKDEIEAGADFGAVAKEHSSCPSGASGGDLGSFGPGMMVPEFDKVVFSADLNTVRQQWLISSTVRRSDGVHVRVVADAPPGDGASSIMPTLEDAYLYLLSTANGDGQAQTA